MQIITVVIKSEHDIILARQRAKQIASLVGLSLIDQTRFVTAVSEITRNAIMYGNGGKIEYSIIEKDGHQMLQAMVIDNSEHRLTDILNSTYTSKIGMGVGIKGTKNLMDYFFVSSHEVKGNIVTFGKLIPGNNAHIKYENIDQFTSKLSAEKPKSFLEEILQQNQILMQTMERLEQRELELQDKLNETVRLNAELQAVNKDLKDFAYVVSHDLKAPLRGINSLAEWIASDYGEKLEDEGKKMLKMLLGRTKRMYSLIEGILQYSKLGRIKEDKIIIDLQDTVENIIQMIKPPENIKVVFDNTLPQIVFEETRIIQVFLNIIENAVKYMDKQIGLIRIGSVDEGNKWRFYISDNGPGIEDKYQEKIFKIFQTLNARDKIESTGIGLTIVKKIIELYEGEIWLESKLNEGTTFLFNLPK